MVLFAVVDVDVNTVADEYMVQMITYYKGIEKKSNSFTCLSVAMSCVFVSSTYLSQVNTLVLPVGKLPPHAPIDSKQRKVCISRSVL